MKTVTLYVASREGVTQPALAAFRARSRARESASRHPRLLWKVLLTAKRREVLKAMAGLENSPSFSSF